MLFRLTPLLAIWAVPPVATLLREGRISSSLTARTCSLSYPAGLHVVQLPELRRQFLLAVPHNVPQSDDGVPLVMAFHGWTDSPWYLNRMAGLSTWLDRYGWIGILPFALNVNGTNGLDGFGACCPPASACDEECCKNGMMLAEKNTPSACRWPVHGSWGVDRPKTLSFVEAMVKWAKDNICVDTTKIFAIGFSSGGWMTNYLACHAPHLFRAFAPIEPGPGDDGLSEKACPVLPPRSYVGFCGSLDACHSFARTNAQYVSKLNNCTGDGPAGAPISVAMSATTRCTSWSKCAEGNFVETCEVVGLPHEISGHLRPDSSTILRPGSDVDAVSYIMEKLSILANGSMLFYGMPTDAMVAEQLIHPTSFTDHLYIREGRLLGADYVVTPAE